jgi:2-amino-4-hydroxy-6-hydroxymethyldihydropteridine diphosphokinase
MPRCILHLGSNLGNRQEHLATAIRYIDRLAGIVVCTSDIYQTAPWGNTEQPLFLNQALVLDTQLSPSILLQRLQNIEHLVGRTPVAVRWSARTIDIDIIAIAQQIIHTDILTVPHPYMHLRRFVLAPLADICPQWVHPTLQKNIQTLYNECADSLAIHKYTPAN